MTSVLPLNRRYLMLLALSVAAFALFWIYVRLSLPAPIELPKPYLHPTLRIGVQQNVSDDGIPMRQIFWAPDRDDDGVPELGVAWHAFRFGDLPEAAYWLGLASFEQYSAVTCVSPVSGEVVLQSKGSDSEIFEMRTRANGLSSFHFVDLATSEAGPCILGTESDQPASYRPFAKWSDDFLVAGPWSVEWAGGEVVVRERETGVERARHSLTTNDFLTPVGADSLWRSGLICFATQQGHYSLHWFDLNDPERLYELPLEHDEWLYLQGPLLEIHFDGYLSKEGLAQVLTTHENDAIAELVTLGESPSRSPFFALSEEQQGRNFKLRELVWLRAGGGRLLVIPQGSVAGGSSTLRYLVQTPQMQEMREYEVDLGVVVERTLPSGGFEVPDQDGDGVEDYLVAWSFHDHALLWVFLSGATGEVLAR